MKYVAYYRVSTDKQGQSGLGLESQQACVREFIKRKSGEQIEEFTEIESGKKIHRKELERAMRRCRLTGATLVIAKLDRLSRDIEFIARLQKSNVDFVCCDMPEANTLTIGILAVMAQHEREMISDRTIAGLQAAKARGMKLGNPNLHLVRNTDTTAATRKRIENAEERNQQVRELVLEFEQEAGRELSARELARRLNKAGYTTARGSAFSHVQIMRIKIA